MFLVHVCYCQTLFTQFQIHCSSLDPHIVHSFMLFCKYLFKLNTSLVYSFATILSFLTSIKAQSVSIDLLILTSIYHSHGPQPTKKYPYLAGDVEYFGQEHWPAIWSVCSLYSTDIHWPEDCHGRLSGSIQGWYQQYKRLSLVFRNILFVKDSGNHFDVCHGF